MTTRTAALEGFRATEVCRLAGITYRQLDYWARQGYVTPSVRKAAGSGTNRLYSLEDLDHVRALAKLRALGLPLQVADNPETLEELLAELLSQAQESEEAHAPEADRRAP
jgi:DNA-binding transcriptional MerR regulator